MSSHSPFAAALFKAVAESASQPQSSLSNEARIALARDALEAWHKPCPFRVKDIVVPAPHSANWSTTLGPCIVSEIYREPSERFDETIGRLIGSDMRLLCADERGVVVEIEAHSRDFVPYTGEGV